MDDYERIVKSIRIISVEECDFDGNMYYDDEVDEVDEDEELDIDLDLDHCYMLEEERTV